MFVAAIFLIALLFVQSAVALCPTTANDVLGANPDSFTSGDNGNDFLRLYAVATNTAGNYLFVQANGYVLRYPAVSGGFVAGTPVRFGRFPGVYPNGLLTPGLCNATRRAVCEPFALSVDSKNRLWVPDVYLRRVTRWDDALHPNVSNPRPSQVYGVNSWTQSRSVTTSVSASVFNSPWYALYQDSADALWVEDYLGSDNSATVPTTRLLRFDRVSTRDVFAGAADAYFGVSSFTDFPTTVPAISATTFHPAYFTIDQLHGTLYVSDDGYNRVLVFKNAATKASGSSADLVIGQSSFTDSSSSASSSALYLPQGLSYDSNNDVLYIVDKGNNRVVGVASASSLTTNRPTFTSLIGQSSFTSKSANRGSSTPSANSLRSPYDVNYNAATNTLYVADSGNGRVVSYQCALNPSVTGSRSPSLAASLTRPATPTRSNSKAATPSHSLTKAATPSHSLTKAATATRAATVSPSVGASPNASPSLGSSPAGTTGAAFKRRFRERRQYF